MSTTKVRINSWTMVDRSTMQGQHELAMMETAAITYRDVYEGFAAAAKRRIAEAQAFETMPWLFGGVKTDRTVY